MFPWESFRLQFFIEENAQVSKCCTASQVMLLKKMIETVLFGRNIINFLRTSGLSSFNVNYSFKSLLFRRPVFPVHIVHFVSFENPHYPNWKWFMLLLRSLFGGEGVYVSS